MGLCWTCIYLISLCYLYKTRQPLLPPLFSLVVLPWEFFFWLKDIPSLLQPSFHLSTGVFIHFCFVLFHLPIVLCLLFRSTAIKKVPLIYVTGLIFITLLYAVLFHYSQTAKFVLSFVCTITGVVFWILATLRKSVPINKQQVFIGSLKMFADFLVYLIYSSVSSLALVLCIILFCLHVIHFIIIVVFYTKTKSIP